MTQSIQAFLDERKELWLKDRLKKAKSETEIQELQQQAAEKFSLAEWLPDAAKRVIQLSMVSHPSKFSHPSAKTSSVIAQAQPLADGYLRSGNVTYPLDVFGNAAAMDVYKFLCIPLSNGKTVLDNLEHNDEQLKQYLAIPTASFDDLRTAFLKIKATDTTSKTDHLVKQVYFPVQSGDEYHLLSLLTPSGLITELKQRIDKLRFSEETKQAKENRKKNELDTIGYADIYDLTVTGYGGTQPQNVSVLNSQNAGRAYLLSSMPPKIEKRAVRLPKTDFFAQCLYRKNFQESFIQLHKLMQLEINNIDIRTAIQNIIKFMIDRVLFEAYKVRENEIYESGWSNQDYYISLPKNQRIWLDNFYQEDREKDDEWRNDISRHIAQWILHSYEKVIQHYFKLGDGELLEVKNFVMDAVKQDKEFF